MRIYLGTRTNPPESVKLCRLWEDLFLSDRRYVCPENLRSGGRTIQCSDMMVSKPQLMTCDPNWTHET
jgi:hypothetical protein